MAGAASGRELAAYFSDKFASIEGFHLEILGIAASGDDLLVHRRMTGRHTGTLLGLAGTGKSITIEGMDHFVLRDGKALTSTIVFDQMAFARQVGLLPPDRSAVDRTLKAAFNTAQRQPLDARDSPACRGPLGGRISMADSGRGVRRTAEQGLP